MLNFRTFLEEDDDDDGWTQEELLRYIAAENATIAEPFYDSNTIVDPDDFYNTWRSEGTPKRVGIFSFTFSYREVRKGDGYEPEGLEIAPWGKAHRHMVYKNVVRYGDDKPILSGRYGIQEGTPIVTFWVANSLVKPALTAMIRDNLIHRDSFVHVREESLGRVSDILKTKLPKKKKELDQYVEIGGRSYALYELPALLHTLPSASPEFRVISHFICNNHDKYPTLKGFLRKAGCGEPDYHNYEPEYTRRKRYWPTSEEVFSDPIY